MRVMVLVRADEKSEAGVLPDEKLLTEMGEYNDRLVEAGLMLAGEGLHPTSKGVRVRFSGSSTTVVAGPFAGSTDLLAGFWIWKVQSMDEAIDWLKKAPFREGELEIRPIFEADDFGDEFTPELRAQEERQREAIADLQ
jgi:hypothetical protein